MRFLIIRFSSIGDIVLCSPMVRSLKRAFPESEIHFLTKKSNAVLLEYNPYIDHVHLLGDSFSALAQKLKPLYFDHIFDLHNNLRSRRLTLKLGRASSHFDKRNLDKFLLTHKILRPLAKPIPHIVQRYCQTLRSVETKWDGGGLDFFVTEEMEAEAVDIIQSFFSVTSNILAVVLGATHATKRWPDEYFISLLNRLQRPVLLLGGPDMLASSQKIASALTTPVFNSTARYSIPMSACLMKQCVEVLTHDTGFMHIAAAFGMKTSMIWGNTVPEFGMSPFQTHHTDWQVSGLDCRPCSKIGYSKCPKGHFRCMKDLKPEEIEL